MSNKEDDGSTSWEDMILTTVLAFAFALMIALLVGEHTGMTDAFINSYAH